MPDYEQLLYDQDGRVVTITLDRPERLNAWTGIMETEFIHAIRHASDDPSVGCIVVTGAGRGFCAGADIGGWAERHGGEIPQHRAPALVMSDAREASPNVALTLAEAKPVVAAINGPAVGIGLTMALGCDIRIASEKARFSARFVRVGLSPECGGTHNLPAVAGLEAALELALTGRIIDAADPLATKLVSRIVPHEELMPTTYALAHEIASGPHDPVWMTKRMIRRNESQHDMRQVVDTETQLFAQLNNQPAHREAVLAFGEKRDPRWHDG
ncbi:MAG: enoyl-CoA hydratase/isomerase family protein [Tepidiformaceae bacterium]